MWREQRESIRHGVDIFDKEHVFLEEELTIIVNRFPKLRMRLNLESEIHKMLNPKNI